jgi:hypothetical protein
MRLVEQNPSKGRPRLIRNQEADFRFAKWICDDIDYALSARKGLEEVWRTARRQYEGIPRQRVRNTPILNAPNLEVTVGATACDSVQAAFIDAIFQASPLLIGRPTNPNWVEHAKAMQVWSNWIAGNEINLRKAVNHASADCCQLGCAAYYIPHLEHKKKTDLFRTVHKGPQLIPIGPENLILPHHSTGDVQQERWVALRFWYTPGEVEDRARQARGKWDVRSATPIAHLDQTRARRLDAARIVSGAPYREMYEFMNVWCSYDYDEDGIEEDLLAVIDRTSRCVVALGYIPTDIRPIEVMQYQIRPHTPYGLGVMEMMAPYEEEATELHNHRVLNSLLANARMWAVRRGSGIDATIEIWPSKVIECDDDPRACIQPLQMSDVYPQLATFESATLGLAEQRVGLRGELSMLARGGSRTPATTALSLLQQTNRRFTPAFDSMRLATAAAIRQCHWRYSERVKAGDRYILGLMEEVLGPSQAGLVEELYRQENFERAVQVEFTAASASVSRESDRQNAIMLANFLRQYYQDVMQGMMMAMSPESPPEIKKVALKVSESISELIERTLRTFDQVRDPSTFIVDLSEELEEMGQMEQNVNGQMGELAGLLGQVPAEGLNIPVPLTGGVA